MKIAANTLITLALFLTPVYGSAQSLEEMNQQYEAVSPLTREKIQTSKVVTPEATDSTPESERLEQLKAQELAEQKARDERIFLDTDYKFFQSLAEPLQEDELDKAHKKEPLEQTVLQAKITDSTVRTEIKTSAPKPLTPAEAAAADARRSVLRKQIASNASTIKACIIEVRKKGALFTGSEMTLAWDITQLGKVEEAKIHSTDVANEEVKKCVLASMTGWDFAESMKNAGKKSRIQYTFRFTKEPKTELALKSSGKTPAQN